MTHSKVKIYVCEMCGKEMADRMSFIHHIIVHFKDQQCEPLPVVTSSIQPVVNDAPKREEMKDKSFHHLVQRLLEPIKAFLKQELVPCLQCGQVFEGIQRLVSHKESHTNNTSGSLRYACWVCSEVFESAKSLVEHEWIHTGMKPYKCDQCEQRFSSKIFWVGHVRGHFLEGRKGHPN
ncbi:hypothetical protein J437_LFUL004362 [Ladona fulva]|uniref:C2H2-type domain-containing protein n=1 Tax=Ladona fulva TaxID=123851 RepID=A0A8K0K5R7_LADFU|nr:hypothetical protein J437_LFUL004362 [Ladona fulva]